MAECIFCNIIERKMPAEILYETEQIIAFRDINPQAPIHILICPRTHTPTVNDLTEEDVTLVGRLLLVAKELAKKENVHETGYRLVLNTNRWAGQSIYHVHLHLLGGRRMSWPPG